MPPDINQLCKKLGYQFNKIELLEQALTHRSLESRNNERMEFLGDSIVNFIVAELLFKTRDKSKEGDLSRFRANLVNRDGLAEIANGFELSDYLLMGTGELRSGGFRRPSILSDALEAIVSAIYLDSNMETCKTVVGKWFQEKIDNNTDVHALKDAKTQLQEYLQAKKLDLPTYELLGVQGEQHQQTFMVECKIPEWKVVAVGQGKSRRRAEQAAAELCLDSLRKG